MEHIYSNLRLSILILLGSYIMAIWLPQFAGDNFKPANISSPMATIGNDLKGIYVSAKRTINSQHDRFFIDGDSSEFPSAVGGVIHAYGPLATVLLLPFAPFDFSVARYFFLILSVSVIIFILIDRSRLLFSNTSKELFVVLSLSFILLITSPGLNLLIERGQMEILVAIAVWYFMRGYLTSLRWTHFVALAFAIHLKLWPVVFASLFFNKRDFKFCVWLFFLSVLPHIILAPFFSITDYMKAIRVYGEYTKDFFGGHNISFSSALYKATNIHWTIWSGLIFAGLFAIQNFIFRIFNQHSIPENIKMLQFSLSILVGMIITGCEFQYVIVSCLLIYPFFWSLHGKVTTVLITLVFSPILNESPIQGYVKALILFVLVLVIAKKLVTLNVKSVISQ